jgi:hypothetical protein
MHFGEGTEVCVPSPQPGYWNAGPGTVTLSLIAFLYFVCRTDNLIQGPFSLRDIASTLIGSHVLDLVVGVYRL